MARHEPQAFSPAGRPAATVCRYQRTRTRRRKVFMDLYNRVKARLSDHSRRRKDVIAVAHGGTIKPRRSGLAVNPTRALPSTSTIVR